MIDLNTRQRFYSKIKRGTGRKRTCWEWQGSRLKRGPGATHGKFRFRGKPWLAHRASWEIHRGPIPEGLWVLHRCCNPPCCNPRHLKIGDHAENMRDKVRDGNTRPGELTYGAKLTGEKVREIRRRYANGETQRSIAADVGVLQDSISRIVNHKRWKHIKEEGDNNV